MKSVINIVVALLVCHAVNAKEYDGPYLGFDTPSEMCEKFGEVVSTGVVMATEPSYQQLSGSMYPMFMVGEVSSYDPDFLDRVGKYLDKMVSTSVVRGYENKSMKDKKFLADLIGRGVTKDCLSANGID